MIKKYLKDIAQITAHQDETEESFYPAVADLLVEFAASINKQDISVTILPKQTEAGNPDFRVWDGNNKIVGYIEAKAPNTDLNKAEISEQLQRYFETFPNVILTDFYEFRLYRNAQLIEKVCIARPFIAKKLKIEPPIENEQNFKKLLERFFDFSLPEIFTAEKLALELAKRTGFLRDQIISVELKNRDGKNYLRGFYNAFKQYLAAGLKESEFADIYSQTVAYGMFAAKTRTKKGETFTRKNAVYNIPVTIGILRDIFEFISLGKLSKQMEVIIDDIAEVINSADIKSILQNFYKQGKGEDPVIHFYETFLDRYDPNTREKRGVYYTPEPVVKYIVNSVNQILITDFNKNGFADTGVKTLDPAGGTLAFLSEAAKKAINTFIKTYGDGSKSDFIKKHILKNFYAFELMMAPYAIAHLKISFMLEEYGYVMEEDDRFQLYLTNTLEGRSVEIPDLPGISSLAEETAAANRIKKETPILAIIGNPPYSKASYNKFDFETELMKLYKKDLTDEKLIGILSDDYIKFIRYCHWKIEESGAGVIGLITKNTYLNVAAAKGMRKQLLSSFDKIYILNLHGKLYEKTPDKKKDESVFNITVGTAIIFLIKINLKKKKDYGKLYYKDLYGERAFKYDYLIKNSLFTTFTEEDEIKTDDTHFFFEKKNFANLDLYNKCRSVDDIFIEKGSGVKTHRDHFIIADDEKILSNRLNSFLNIDAKDAETVFKLNPTANFNVVNVKKKFLKFDNNKIEDYIHKPFLKRKIYYEKLFIDRYRFALMKYFYKKENIGLITSKRYFQKGFDNIFVTENLTDINFLGYQSYIFPLWIYKQNGDVFNGNGKYKNRVSNINPNFEEALEKIFGKENISEKIFYYIYAVMYSDIYRNDFAELLKIDYPKIPFTKNFSIFQTLAKLGKELSELHLLTSAKINKPKVKFCGKGDCKVGYIKYDKKKKILKINDSQYFDNISEKLWEFKIGKNRIIRQQIKRKEKIEYNDAIQFCKIAEALYQTFNLQKKIDKIYPNILKELIENKTK